MTTYRYKGQTKDGTAVSGVIRAYDEFEAALGSSSDTGKRLYRL